MLYNNLDIFILLNVFSTLFTAIKLVLKSFT